jgi:hypothetical protein
MVYIKAGEWHMWPFLFVCLEFWHGMHDVPLAASESSENQHVVSDHLHRQGVCESGIVSFTRGKKLNACMHGAGIEETWDLTVAVWQFLALGANLDTTLYQKNGPLVLSLPMLTMLARSSSSSFCKVSDIRYKYICKQKNFKRKELTTAQVLEFVFPPPGSVLHDWGEFRAASV